MLPPGEYYALQSLPAASEPVIKMALPVHPCLVASQTMTTPVSCHAVSTAEGVYNASQALRLLQRQRGVAADKHESKPETLPAASALAAQQQWCLHWLYLTALLQLGMLHLLAGVAEDALLCLQQGRHLVRLPAANH